MSYYLDKGKIVKVTESGSIGDGSWKTEYYFLGGKMIFCFETTIGGPAISVFTRTERRLHVESDSPLRFMKGKHVVEPGDDARQFIRVGYKLLKAYTTKDFAAALCNA